MKSESTPFPKDDRGRGILTSDDRAFLKGQKEFANEQSERDARYRIRQRVLNAILDFNILYNHLDDKDRDQIFEPLARVEEISSEPPNEEGFNDLLESLYLRDSVMKSISFFYEGIEESGLHFDDVLEQCIMQIESNKGFVVDDVDVEIQVDRDRPSIDELLMKFESDESLSRGEINTIVQSGELELSEETLTKLVGQVTEAMSEGIDQSLSEFQKEMDDE